MYYDVNWIIDIVHMRTICSVIQLLFFPMQITVTQHLQDFLDVLDDHKFKSDFQAVFAFVLFQQGMKINLQRLQTCLKWAIHHSEQNNSFVFSVKIT